MVHTVHGADQGDHPAQQKSKMHHACVMHKAYSLHHQHSIACANALALTALADSEPSCFACLLTSPAPAAFFAWGCALIDHSGWPEFKRKMKVDFVPTLAAEVSIWPIVQSVNFSVVPLQHQLLVINVFTIIDAAFMSWARNQEDWVTKVLAALPGGNKGGSSSSGAQLQMKPLVAESSKKK